MPHSPPSTRSSHGGGDALGALLETERALGERLSTATAEAERILSEARARATEAARELEASTSRELAALEKARERSLREELASIAARARADRARFEGVSDDRIRDLAARAVALVLGA